MLIRFYCVNVNFRGSLIVVGYNDDGLVTGYGMGDKVEGGKIS